MKRIFFTIAAIFAVTLLFSQEARLMRFPTMHGDQIVFTYAGDLYTVAKTGGMARKLTSDDGYEMFAKFSPDGKHIAFTAQYDGNTEVYVMPANGGTPKRLTYTATLKRDDVSDRMGPNNIVMAWTPDSKYIIYRSRKQTFNSFVGQLFKVSIEGGLSEQLPLATGGFCSYSEDGSKLAFNQVFREFRTWKYYKGGMADDIRIFDFNSKEIIKITDHVNQDIFPMYHGNKVYFCSDRDRTMNLFVYDTDSKETKKLTNFTDYDIKYPSKGDKGIIFEKEGYIYIFDFETQESKKVSIQISNDQINGRNEIVDAGKYINSIDVAPDGKRVVIGARGDVFTVPANKGITRNLTKSSGAHDRNAVWSPDGKYIAFISDKSGEYEIYIQKQDGSEPAIQLTKKADTYKYRLKWSPDSKKIMWSDKKLRLRYIDIDSKKITEVAKSKIWEYTQFDWSPDSKWITYVDQNPNRMGQIKIYDLEKKESYDITDGFYSSMFPTFSDDGKYLFFSSMRDFNPIYSETEWNHAYRERARIYFVTLAKDTKNPFAHENDEVEIKEENGDKKEEDKKDDSKDIKVDIDGIQQRIIDLPGNPANYFNISIINEKVYYLEIKSGKGMALKMYDLKSKKETDLGEGMNYTISANGKKMLVMKGRNYSVINLPSSKISLKESIDLSNLTVNVNKKEEWKQIYEESWRQMRDFFYVENMHGVNWKAMHDKYAPLVEYVNDRNDLNYIIGELIGELSVGHAYVNGGDKASPKRINTGLLGAQVSKHSSGYYKIDKILKGENFRSNYRSPLTEVGVDVNVGDYIIAINGTSVKDVNDIYELLLGTAEKEVEIAVFAEPSESNTRKSIIKPIADESKLYYYNWVEENLEKVTKATNGEVGYIHIPNMIQEGLNEFAKYFYPQLHKKALIIDDRGNGGGNVSPMIIERLKREITRSNMARNVEIPGQTPRQMMKGPKVLLLNQYSASDGDLFPYSFKKHNLGKTIGVRSWGGVVGIRGSLPFIDGGDLRKPEFASYSATESKWIIEGWGVEPDIIVENDPYKEYMGEDAQLNKAIEVILEELKNYKPLPDIPQGPDKTK